jgi:hypothetical protein
MYTSYYYITTNLFTKTIFLTIVIKNQHIIFKFLFSTISSPPTIPLAVAVAVLALNWLLLLFLLQKKNPLPILLLLLWKTKPLQCQAARHTFSAARPLTSSSVSHCLGAFFPSSESH